MNVLRVFPNPWAAFDKEGLPCGVCPRDPESDGGAPGQYVGARVDRKRTKVATPGSRIPQDIARYIDHTLLKPDATYAEIDNLCDEASKYGFASVCVNAMHVKRCAEKLKGSRSVVCTVVGFPLGATPKEIKALEARKAIRDGARE